MRHAPSIANEWMQKPGNEWGAAAFCDDTQLRDAPLSEAGRQAASAANGPEKLAAMLQQCSSDDEIVVVVSPLTRCLETWYYSVRPFLERSNFSPPPPRTIVQPLATERVYTSSDTGRTKSQLQQAFPQQELDWSLLPEDDDAWWYTGGGNHHCPEWRPHGQGQYYAVPGEPQDAFAARMKALEDWLADLGDDDDDDQPKLIVLVSHWGVLRHLTKQEVRNGGICTWQLEMRNE